MEILSKFFEFKIVKIVFVLASVVFAELIVLFNPPIKYLIPAGLFGILAIIIGIQDIRIPLYIFIVSIGLGELLETNIFASTFLVIPGLYLSISWLLRVLLTGKSVKFNSYALVFAFLLGIWSTISALQNGNVSSSRPYWFVLILFLLLQNLYSRKEDFIVAGWVILVALLFISLFVFIDRAILIINSGGNISINNLHIASLPFGDKNTVGMYISLGIPIAYFLANIQTSSKKKLLLRLILGFLALGVFAVFSLGVMIGVMGMAFLILVLDWQTLKKNKYFLIIAFVILLLYISGPILERIQGQIELVEEKGILALGTNRVFLWLTSLKVISADPWFGHGVGTGPLTQAAFSYVPHEYWDLIVVKRGNKIIPHNSFLTVAAQIGLPGAFFFSVIRIWNIYVIFRSRVRIAASDLVYRNLLSMYLVILVGGFVQSQGLSAQLDKLLWYMMGSSLALISLYNEPIKQKIEGSKLFAC